MYTQSILGIFSIFAEYIFKISGGKAEQLGGGAYPPATPYRWNPDPMH